MDEELEYVSSSDLLKPAIRTKPKDEEDLSTLKKVQSILGKKIESYSSINSLVLGDKTFTIEQQLAVNAKITSHLIGLKSIVDDVIDDIREKYKGGTE